MRLVKVNYSIAYNRQKKRQANIVEDSACSSSDLIIVFLPPAHNIMRHEVVDMRMSCTVCRGQNLATMKPAPFDKKYEYREPSSGRRVVSTEAFGTKVFDSDGTTEIYTIPGCFSGRRTISLSSDGATLIFDGNYYFGDSFLRTPDIDDDEVVTVIYHQGYVWKEVCFKTDLNTAFMAAVG